MCFGISMSFSEYYDFLKEKNHEERGPLFEKGIRDYLLESARYKGHIKDVSLWKDWRYAESRDLGIDLVAEGHSGEFWAVQCKFLGTSSTTLRKKHIEPCISASGKTFKYKGKRHSFKGMFLVATTDKIGLNANEILKDQIPPCKTILMEDLLTDDSVSWKKGVVKGRKNKKGLRGYQQKAVDSIQTAFEDPESPLDRAKLIMACGTGKTFTSLKASEALKAHRILYLVPSLALLGQIKKEWIENAEKNQVHLVVSSDKTIKTEEIQEDSSDRFLSGFPSTTDVKEITDFLKKAPTEGTVWSNQRVVFSTYHSLEQVCKAQKEDPQIPDFDLVICDEAHRCTGLEKKEFSLIFKKEEIRVRKRLFMTATPRIYTKNTQEKGKKRGLSIFSMDDEEAFGKEVFRYGFTEAIEDGNLCDFKVVILTNTRNSKVPKSGTKKAKEVNAISEVFNEPISKFLKEKGLKRGLVFMNTIEKSKEFKEECESSGESGFSVDHIDGTMGGARREGILKWLREGNDEIRLLSHVRCLSEGVDIPKIDACIFGMARKSSVDIVQAVGRAIRKSEGKEYGYVLLPIVVPEGENQSQIDRAFEDSQYNVIWQVLNALRSHNPNLGLEIDQLRFKDRKSERISIWDADTGEERYLSNSIDEGCEQAHQLDLFTEPLTTKILKKVGDSKYFEHWYENISGLGTQLKKEINKETCKNEIFRRNIKKLKRLLQENVNKNISHKHLILMLVQHLITEPVFEALFPKETIMEHNAIARLLEDVMNSFSRDKASLRSSLNDFYEAVKKRAQNIHETKEKQEFLNHLYEKFFHTFDSKRAERDGIVYTPQEIVEFMIHMTDQIMEKEFGYGLEKEDVHIIDPFTGTGNFILNTLKYLREEKKVSKETLKRKYLRELHANEISLLPYYIASANIEHYYNKEEGLKEPFEGLCLVDTFSLYKKKFGAGYLPLEFEYEKNTKRIEKQKNLPLQVFISNPPYNQGQKSENDNNKTIKYEELEKRINQTYVEKCSDKKANKRAFYNSYIKAFRFASDKLEEKGVIAFITNNRFISAGSFSGFRISLEEEFHSIYHFDLKGNCRNSGKEELEKHGGNVFGIKTGVGITFLVKKPGEKKGIFLYRVKDYTTKEKKIEEIKNLENLEEIPLEKIEPLASFWIDHGKEEWKDFIPLRSDENEGKGIFEFANYGQKTNRDKWVYDFNESSLQDKIELLISTYSKDLEEWRSLPVEERSKKSIDNFVTEDIQKIKWDSKLKKDLRREKELIFKRDNFRRSLQKPFQKAYLYYDDRLINRKSKGFNAFPSEKWDNISIALTDKSKGDFSCLLTRELPDMSCLKRTRHLPLYIWEEGRKRGNVTDFALSLFQEAYEEIKITKRDVFAYVYAILNSAEYRETYKKNLFRENAKVPLFKKKDDFFETIRIGKKLIELHSDYENLPPCKEVRIQEAALIDPDQDPDFYKVKKMKLSKDKRALHYNKKITIEDIPEQAYEWKVNGNGAIEELVKAYRVQTLDNGFIGDPNTWRDGKYIYELVLSVLTLSVETARLCRQIPKIEGNIKKKERP